MCTTCGCGDAQAARLTAYTDASDEGRTGHPHHHPHDAYPDHHADHDDHAQSPARTIMLEQQILAKNDRLAEENRRWLRARGILALNLMSSPGAGKTTLLERTIREIGESIDLSVVEGDQETPLDAKRIRRTGRPVVQVNTGAGCHLDAEMLAGALRALDPADGSTLFVENVGNLVCPALFDLGETGRVVVASVTEGDDKPLKYPHMFRSATLVVLNKVDLMPYVEFDQDAFVGAVHAVNPAVEILTVSATAGQGLQEWYDRVRRLGARARLSSQSSFDP